MEIKIGAAIIVFVIFGVILSKEEQLDFPWIDSALLALGVYLVV